MKGYIKGKTVILLEELPDNLQEGDEVEIKISPTYQTKTTFPTFKLGVKDEYLKQENFNEYEILAEEGLKEMYDNEPDGLWEQCLDS